MPDMILPLPPAEGRPATANATPAAPQTAADGSAAPFYDALSALLGLGNGEAASGSVPALPLNDSPLQRQEILPDGNTLPPYAAAVPLPVNVAVQNGASVAGDNDSGAAQNAVPAFSAVMIAGNPLISAAPVAENPHALSDISQAMLARLSSESAMPSGNFASALNDNPSSSVSQPAGISQMTSLAGPQPSQQNPAAHVANAMTLPLGAEGWGQELGNRVQWLVGQNVQAAELRINPPHLGPVEIRISVDQDQASVSFTAQHSVTRDAIEAAIPRLRDMLGDNGLNLANVNVSSQSQSFADQRGQQSVPRQYTEFMGGAEPLVSDESSSAVRGVSITGLVDYYA